MNINKDSKGIKIKRYLGLWYVIDESYFEGEKVFLLESETYGDESSCLIVNEDGKIIMSDVCNGFDDLDSDPYDSYIEDDDYKDYSPSNPWDAPGMKMSDFI